MPQAVSRHDIEHMLAQGLSQREISRQTGIPRSTMQRLLKAPMVPEVISKGRPGVTPSRPERDRFELSYATRFNRAVGQYFG
jgi:transposase